MNKTFAVVAFWVTAILSSNIVFAQAQSILTGQGFQRAVSNFVCPIYIDKQPSSATVCEGANVVFEVEVSNTSEVAEKYEWQKSADGKAWSSLSINGLSNQLNLTNISLVDDQKLFRALIYVKSNGEECQLVSNQVSLRVIKIPKVSIVLEEQVCNPLKEVKLSTKIENDSELNIINWSTAGKGSLSSLVGESTTYIFDEKEVGKSVLIFANHQINASSCKAKKVSAKIFINDIDCGTFPWSGTN